MIGQKKRAGKAVLSPARPGQDSGFGRNGGCLCHSEREKRPQDYRGNNGNNDHRTILLFMNTDPGAGGAEPSFRRAA